jgi:hypothetical protein
MKPLFCNDIAIIMHEEFIIFVYVLYRPNVGRNEGAACNYDAPQNVAFSWLSSWTTAKSCPHDSSIVYVYGLMYPGNFDGTKTAECMP